jgi:3-oxoadipate enol-lactonase
MLYRRQVSESRVSFPEGRTARFVTVVCVLSGAILTNSGCGRSDVATATKQEGVLSLPGTTLSYELSGQGPPVVLVPGGGFDRRLWDDQVEVLAEHFRVLRYDVRGSGQSGGFGEQAFRHHEDLAALLNHLGITSAAIVGQSLGGRIAFDLALTHPDLVSKIVAVGPGVSGWPWGSHNFGPWLDSFAQALRARDTARAVEAWLGSGYMTAPAEQPRLRELIGRYARENVRAWLDDGNEPELAPPALTRLEQVTVPVLLVIGSRDERVIQLIGDTLVVRMPNVQRVVFEGAGHAPNLEQVEHFNRVVGEFLKK